VLEFSDPSNSGWCSADNVFASKRLNGSVAFWWRQETISAYHISACPFLYEGTTCVIYIYYDKVGNWIRYWNGTGNNIFQPTADAWYHITIEWTSAGWQMTVNGTLYGVNCTYGFYNSMTDGLDRLFFSSRRVDGGSGYKFYVDAVDYSWSPGYFTNRSYEYYGQTYYNTSQWTSQIMDLEVITSYYGDLTLSYETNANTSVTISYRMSTDNSTWVHYNGSAWENGWSTWTSPNMSLQIYGIRYFQVRVLLTTTNIQQTPTVYAINAKVYLF